MKEAINNEGSPSGSSKTTQSPYERNFVNKLFFFYMNAAMALANEREGEGSCLKGMSLCSIPSEKILRV